MELTPLNILYIVLTVAVLVVGGLLAVVLWQVSLAVAQARTVFIPQIQAILKETEANLVNVDGITEDVNQKLEKLDQAVDAANTAVQAIGQTTVLVNKAVAQPVVVQVASLVAGLQGAWGYMSDHGFRSRRERRSETRTPVMARETVAPAPAPSVLESP
ncbi:MAG TPA: hypothetical protein V6D05_10360 [Stenomitos sp.]